MSIVRLEEPRVMPKTPPKGFALFAFGFRPFYLVGALLAAIGVPVWIAVLAGGMPLMPVFPAMLWHGHEMLFGFVVAIIVIKWFVGLVSRRGFGPFAWYRIVAGIIALVWLSIR